ncbi:MAG: LytTR family transcriptional regulator DNA-binding domain-containing protein [Bacteroidales bacterium]|nr:LytTR family transcriptional regulator DNA-binding domain-containing protein [Bacteroidales bacterium]
MGLKTSHIFFNSRDELFRVDLSSVVYFEADGNYTNFVSVNGRTDMVCINLGKMEEFLALRRQEASSSFARVGKRHILNLRYVYRINTLKQELTLSDQRTFEYTITISKIALKALKELVSPHKAPEGND